MRILLLVLVLLPGLSSAAASRAPSTPGLQLPGTFHDGEAIARDGERWLALHVEDDAARLVDTRVRVARVHDVMLDEDGGATAHEVAGEEPLVAYVRGRGLRAGAVARAQMQGRRVEAGPLGQALRLGMHRYTIGTRCTPAVVDAGAGAEAGSVEGALDCAIELAQDGGGRQVLARMRGHEDTTTAGAILLGDDATPKVVFAGDLDGDGKLDLIFDTTDHYNVSRPVLFLSGAATQDELVRAVAQYDAVGC